MRLIPVFNILFLMVILSFPAHSKTTSKTPPSAEQTWLNILKNSPVKQQIINLKTRQGTATALYLPQSSGQPQGGLIILHGRAQHPDWHVLIKPLRTRFPKFGWATLSLQLPLHGSQANSKDYVKSMDLSIARIDAAITFLHSRKIQNIVIAGYEFGANTAAAYLLKRPKSRVQALISISLLTHAKPEQLNANRAMSLLKQPILDVYAMNDRNDILHAVNQRKPLIKQHRNLNSQSRDPKNARYRQLEIEGADHSYLGYEQYLIKRLRSWLRVFAPGKSITHAN